MLAFAFLCEYLSTLCVKKHRLRTMRKAGQVPPLNVPIWKAGLFLFFQLLLNQQLRQLRHNFPRNLAHHFI